MNKAVLQGVHGVVNKAVLPCVYGVVNKAVLQGVHGVVNKAVLTCVHGVVWGFSCTHILHRQAEITFGSDRTKSRLEKWSHGEQWR